MSYRRNLTAHAERLKRVGSHPAFRRIWADTLTWATRTPVSSRPDVQQAPAAPKDTGYAIDLANGGSFPAAFA